MDEIWSTLYELLIIIKIHLLALGAMTEDKGMCCVPEGMSVDSTLASSGVYSINLVRQHLTDRIVWEGNP